MSYQPKHSSGSLAAWESRQIREDRIRDVAEKKHAGYMREYTKYTGDLNSLLFEVGQGDHERVTDTLALYIEQAFRARDCDERQRILADLGGYLYEFVSDAVWKEAMREARFETPDE